MDPAFSINMGFVYEQQREWACAATARPVPYLAADIQLGLVDRLCSAVGDWLIAAGLRLKMRTTPLPHLATFDHRERQS